MRAFGWSLPDIDNADIQSLLPFVNTYINQLDEIDVKGNKTKHATGTKKTTKIYCDDPKASWL